MAIIKVKDVLQLLRLNPGTITVCTYDARRPEKTGKRVTYVDCKLTGFDEGGTPKGIEQRSNAHKQVGRTGSKSPHFRATATTNIRCQNGEPVTIHPCLIESFNGQRVTI